MRYGAIERMYIHSCIRIIICIYMYRICPKIGEDKSNSADPDLSLQNASDQDPHSLSLTDTEAGNTIKLFKL